MANQMRAEALSDDALDQVSGGAMKTSDADMRSYWGDAVDDWEAAKASFGWQLRSDASGKNYYLTENRKVYLVPKSITPLEFMRNRSAYLK